MVVRSNGLITNRPGGTLLAFKLAAKHGATVLEFDGMRSSRHLGTVTAVISVPDDRFDAFSKDWHRRFPACEPSVHAHTHATGRDGLATHRIIA